MQIKLWQAILVTILASIIVIELISLFVECTI